MLLDGLSQVLRYITRHSKCQCLSKTSDILFEAILANEAEAVFPHDSAQVRFGN